MLYNIIIVERITMKESRMFKELMAKKEELRVGLFKVMKRKRISLRAAAAEVGISPVSLHRFFNTEKPMQYLTLSKIDDYIELNNEKK